MLALVYFVCSKLARMTILPGEAASFIWPAAGVSVAALFIYGYNLWPGVALGTILASGLTTEDFFPTEFYAALGSALGALIGAFLLMRVGFDRSLERIKDVTKFAIFGVIVASTISATIGVYGLLLGNLIPPDEFFYTWSTWWIGDTLGILIYAPLLFLWDGATLKRLLRKRNRIPLFPIVTFSTLIIICIVVFQFLPLTEEGVNPYKFLVIPIFPIIALYFGQRGNTTAMAIAFTIAIVSTTFRYAPEQSHYLSLAVLQQAVGLLSISFMYITAGIAERDQARRKLEMRTMELNRQSTYFKQLNKAKDEFISFASHQLRTPATGIKMYLGMLRNDAFGPLTREQKNSIDIVFEANERQINLIEDLLTTAEVDMGEFVLSKTKTNINNLIHDVIQGLLPAINSRNQTIHYDCEPGNYIRAIDPLKMSIVVENLIDNASKYSANGNDIEVKLSLHDGHVYIKVKDEGVGIAKKDMKNLYKKFSRIENKLSSERGGNGLGLYMIKQIVMLHGGEMSVSSKPGAGTTFTVIL